MLTISFNILSDTDNKGYICDNRLTLYIAYEIEPPTDQYYLEKWNKCLEEYKSRMNKKKNQQPTMVINFFYN